METGSGSEADLEEPLDRLLPRDDRYRHRHGSPGHGADHLLPVLVSPSLIVPGRGRPAAARHLAERRARRPQRRQPPPPGPADLPARLSRPAQGQTRSRTARAGRGDAAGRGWQGSAPTPARRPVVPEQVDGAHAGGRGPSTSGPQVSPTNRASAGGQPQRSRVWSKMRGWGLRAPAWAEVTTDVEQVVEVDAGHGAVEVPVPVRADGHAPALAAAARPGPRDLVVGGQGVGLGGPVEVGHQRVQVVLAHAAGPGPGAQPVELPARRRRLDWWSARRGPRRRGRRRPTGCPTPPGPSSPGGRRPRSWVSPHVTARASVP